MTDTSTDPQAELEQLRTQLAESETQRQSLARDRAFTDAGLPNVPELELFRASYQGDLTPEAIKAEAAKYPALVVDPNATTAPAVDNDLEAMRRIAGATAGGVATGALPDFGTALDNARSPQELDHLLSTGGIGAGIGLKGRVI